MADNVPVELISGAGIQRAVRRRRHQVAQGPHVGLVHLPPLPKISGHGLPHLGRHLRRHGVTDGDVPGPGRVLRAAVQPVVRHDEQEEAVEKHGEEGQQDHDGAEHPEGRDERVGHDEGQHQAKVVQCAVRGLELDRVHHGGAPDAHHAVEGQRQVEDGLPPVQEGHDERAVGHPADDEEQRHVKVAGVI